MLLLDAKTADAASVAESVPDAAHAASATMAAHAMLWLLADAVIHSNIMLQLVASAAVPALVLLLWLPLLVAAAVAAAAAVSVAAALAAAVAVVWLLQMTQWQLLLLRPVLLLPSRGGPDR